MPARRFDMLGPDQNGNVWIASAPDEPESWSVNLGPFIDVTEAMSQWLGSIDYDEYDESPSPRREHSPVEAKGSKGSEAAGASRRGRPRLSG